MTVAFDARTGYSDGTLSFTHTPSGTPRGVVVLVVSRGSGVPTVTGVTYGGVPLTEITAGRGNITASGSDNGQASIWLLGASVPTGAQTCVVTFSAGTTPPFIVNCTTLTADANVEEVDSISADDYLFNSGNSYKYTDTLLTDSRSSWAAYAYISGYNTFNNVAEWSGFTRRTAVDFGTGIGAVADLDTVTSSNIAFGNEHPVVSEEIGIVGAAFSEVAVGAAPTLSDLKAASITATTVQGTYDYVF